MNCCKGSNPTTMEWEKEKEGHISLRQLFSSDEMLREICERSSLTDIVNFTATIWEAMQVADNDEDRELLSHAWDVVYEEALKIRNTMSDAECMEWLKSNYFDVKTPKECN